MKKFEMKDYTQALSFAEKLCYELTPSPQHAIQVSRLSVFLFDALYECLNLSQQTRQLLQIAALLHDVGQSIDFPQHHKHSRDIILKSTFPGLTEEEKQMVALIARYHRKKHPDPSHRFYTDLKKSQQRTVCALASLLRIADGLDRSQMNCTKVVKVDISKDMVSIYVTQEHENQLDIWGADRKRLLLEELLHREVRIIVICDQA